MQPGWNKSCSYMIYSSFRWNLVNFNFNSKARPLNFALHSWGKQSHFFSFRHSGNIIALCKQQNMLAAWPKHGLIIIKFAYSRVLLDLKFQVKVNKFHQKHQHIKEEQISTCCLKVFIFHNVTTQQTDSQTREISSEPVLAHTQKIWFLEKSFYLKESAIGFCYM